jgi:ferredoxin-NADP reductase
MTMSQQEEASNEAGAPEARESLRVRVEEARLDSEDVRRVVVGRDDGEPLPAVEAGAHVDIAVYLPDKSKAYRSYSISSPPSNEPDTYTLAVLWEDDGTGGSWFMHENVRVGYILEMTQPKNYFKLNMDAAHTVLIAGGIGITPILAMAHQLKAANKPFKIHYSAKTPQKMAFRKLILEQFEDETDLHFDGGKADNFMDLAEIMGPADPGRHVYVCGPMGMINAVRDVGRKKNWAEENVHFEVFTPPPPVEGQRAFQVVINGTGQTLEVPKDRSILSVLLENGIDSDYECEMGICGTCATKVLEGEPVHRDNTLTDTEHASNMMCTCVSRTESDRLVLDI